MLYFSVYSIYTCITKIVLVKVILANIYFFETGPDVHVLLYCAVLCIWSLCKIKKNFHGPFLAHLSWKLKWVFLINCCLACVHLSVCLSVCKFFIFSSSSPQLPRQFQPNLEQSILGCKWFKIVQMTGHNLFQREIIWKIQ